MDYLKCLFKVAEIRTYVCGTRVGGPGYHVPEAFVIRLPKKVLMWVVYLFQPEVTSSTQDKSNPFLPNNPPRG